MPGAFWLPLAWLLVSLALQVGWQGLSQNLGQKKSLRARLNRLGGGLRPPAVEGDTPSPSGLSLPFQGWLGTAGRIFYFVGLPYLAVISGVLTPRLLGLKGVEYFVLTREADTLAAPFQQALALTFLEWLLDSQLLLPLSLLTFLFLAAIRWRLFHDRAAWAAPEISVLEVIYTGLHWAFYRAIFWAVTGDLYLGLVWGAGAVMIEWLLVSWLQKQFIVTHPDSQTQFGSQDRLQQVYGLQATQTFLIQLMLLILTSLLFFYTPNLWLIWPVHLALLAVLAYQKAPEGSARPLISS
jgi:hypothetical protein